MPMNTTQINWLAEITGKTEILSYESDVLNQQKSQLEQDRDQEGISDKDKEEKEKQLSQIDLDIESTEIASIDRKKEVDLKIINIGWTY